MNSDSNPNCPTFCWRSEYDNRQQKMWCPISQNQQVLADGTVLGMNYNLMDVFTGGNMKQVNAEQIIEKYGPGFSGMYRPINQTANNLAGPLCYGARASCIQQVVSPTLPPQPSPSPMPSKMKEKYCPCTTKNVMASGINTMSTY